MLPSSLGFDKRTSLFERLDISMVSDSGSACACGRKRECCVFKKLSSNYILLSESALLDPTTISLMSNCKASSDHSDQISYNEGDENGERDETILSNLAPNI